MKTMRKIIPVLLAALLAAVLSVPAAAADIQSYGEWQSDGTLSAEIGEGVTWICDTSGEENRWFGIDNRERTLPDGSRIILSYDWDAPDTSSGSNLPHARYAGNYEVYFGLPDGGVYAPAEPTIFVQLGSSPGGKEHDEQFLNSAGEAVTPISVCNLASPEGVATFAEVPVPTDGLVCSNHFNDITIGDISGTLEGSAFSGGGWLTVAVLVELGVIVGLAVGLFAKKKG